MEAGIFNRLRNLFQRRSASVSDYIERIFSRSIDTAAGKQVSEYSALNLSTVFACVRLLSNTIASTPLILYRRLDNEGSKERATDHPLYNLLHLKFNLQMTAYRGLQTMQGHLATWGNAFAYKEFDGRTGALIGLHPLAPNKVKISTDTNGFTTYTYRKDNSSEIPLPSYAMLHIPGFGYDGIQGYSIISLARESIGLGLGTEEFGSRFFSQGTNIGGFLKYPGQLDKDKYARLKKDLNEKAEGLGKSHKWLILEDGTEPIRLGIPPNDAQFLETREFQAEEIAGRWYGIPPYMVGLTSKSTSWGSGIEQQQIGFLTFTMLAWFTLWEQELTLSLLRGDEQEEYFIEFQTNNLLRGDIKSRFDAYAIGRQWGWLSTNDIRKLENMNPVEDGDDYLTPLNMIAKGEEMPEKPDKPELELIKKENQDAAGNE